MTKDQWIAEFQRVLDLHDEEMTENRRPSEIVALVLAKAENARARYPSGYMGFDPLGVRK